MKLQPHPRLYIGRKEFSRLARPVETPFLRAAARWVEEKAGEWVSAPPLAFNSEVHNALLLRAREIQERVMTLLVRWGQTGEGRYRDAVIEHVRLVAAWECWSWIAWRKGDCRPEAIYDLSYGENAATLAIARDLLDGTLSDAEKDLFRGIAERWPFRAGLAHCRAGGAGWFGRADSNWNAVCAGGLGMLCLAMHDEMPAARRLLPRVEESLLPFISHLDRTDGAWPEGVGYWNYGMRYAFMYLLSREKSTGQSHPLMALRGVRRTLEFPLDFTPNGQPCSFGDVNSWTPLPFHYAAARRLRAASAAGRIDAFLGREPQAACRGSWAPAAGWLLFHDDRPAPAPAPGGSGAKLYRGVDWVVLADRFSAPGLFMSLRGGTTGVPHSHCDLFSFNLAVNDEKLIAGEGNAEYLDTTFSPRRYDLPDINAQYKNTILVNGLGVPPGASLDSTRVFNRAGVSGARLAGSSAMGLSRDGEAAVKFCARLVLMLENRAFLVVDRVVTRHPARVESRLHTHARVRRLARGAHLSGRRESMRLAFAADVPGLLARATTAPTTPSAEPARMLRWCTRALHRDMVLAVLLVPGPGPAGLAVRRGEGGLVLDARFPGTAMEVALTGELRLRSLRKGMTRAER